MLLPLAIYYVAVFYLRHRRARTIFDCSGAWLTAIALLGGILGLARPQLGRVVTTSLGAFSNLVVAIDISQSQTAQDVPPTRLEFSITFVQQLLNQLPQVRVALYPFSERGFLAMPFTTDKQAANEILSTISTASTTAHGTDFSDSLKDLYRQIKLESDKAKAREENWPTPRVLLLSDGETHHPLSADVISLFKQSQIPVFTVGVGSLKGAPISPYQPWYLQSLPGTPKQPPWVLSKLDESVLKQLSQNTQGKHYLASLNEIPRLVASLQQSLQLGRLQSTFKKERDYYPFLFLLSFLCLMIHASKGRWEYLIRSLLVALWFINSTPLMADDNLELKAIQKYNDGLKTFLDHNFRDSAENFEESYLTTNSTDIKKQSLFNLGNSLLSMERPDQALQVYQQAYDMPMATPEVNTKWNQMISDNIVLAKQIQQQQQNQKQNQGNGKGEDDGKQNPKDPGGPKKYQNDTLSEAEKKKLWDLVRNQEKQTTERLQQNQNQNKPNSSSKPW